jgi:hypothetical protein
VCALDRVEDPPCQPKAKRKNNQRVKAMEGRPSPMRSSDNMVAIVKKSTVIELPGNKGQTPQGRNSTRGIIKGEE